MQQEGREKTFYEGNNVATDFDVQIYNTEYHNDDYYDDDDADCYCD